MLAHEFPPFRGGIATYCAELARAATQLGHRVTVLAPSYGADHREHDWANYPFTVVRYRGGSYSCKALPAVLWRTLRSSRQYEYDILHAVDPSYLMALAALNRFTRIPHVATAYGTEILGLGRSKQAKLLGATALFRHAAAIYAISNYSRSLVEESLDGNKKPPIRVTPLGVHPDWFTAVSSDTVRQRFGIGHDRTIMLTVSRLDERKGHRVALKALGLLSADIRRRLTYCVVGDGGSPAYLAEMNRLADASGTQVVFTGGVDHTTLRQLYAAAAFFCMPGEPHPRRVEGFGLVYLEAAAQGLPSIASRLGAVPEIVRHRETGLIAAPNNPPEVAEAIRLLVKDETLRSDLGRNARAMAREYTWQRCAELTYGD